jgi:hypothetical protein
VFNIPKELRMPAPEWLLAVFTAVAAGSVSRSCVNGWLSGISFWHSVNGAKWNGENQLQIAKAAVSKMVPKSSKQEKRLPVTLEWMLALLKGLDFSNSLDSAVWACTVTLFKDVCRGSKFLVPSCGTFNKKIPCPSQCSSKVGEACHWACVMDTGISIPIYITYAYLYCLKLLLVTLDSAFMGSDHFMIIE